MAVKIKKPAKPKVKTFRAKKPKRMHGVKHVKPKTVVLGS